MRRSVVISLCDLTGNMMRPWADAGYLCICVDIQHSPRATRSGKHKVDMFSGGGEIHYIYGDARSWKPTIFDKLFFDKYKICFVSCFPVCTNMSGSGAQDWQLKGLNMLTDGLILFSACETMAAWSGAPYCLENPVGALSTHHRRPDYYFHQWFWGDLYTKKTGLWVGNGFKMPPTDYITQPHGVKQKIWLASQGKNRQNERSETPEGFARAVFNYNKIES